MKKNTLAPVLIIIALVLLMTGRYLLSGVPHEYLGPEFKGTFEGDYDFTLEAVKNIASGRGVPLWSFTYSGPAFVFAANLHVLGQVFLYFLTRDPALSIKIYQVLYFIFAGLGMFFLARHLYKNLTAALFCAILYTFTPFFIGEMLGYLHYSATYFCMPLAFLFMFKALDSSKPLRFALLASLVIAFNLLSHPQNVFIAGLFYFLFALGILYIKPVALPAKKMLKIFFLVFSAVFLLSMFFILPTLIDGYPYTRSLTQGGTWLKFSGSAPDVHSAYHSQSFFSAMTLFHWPWFITPLKNGIYPPAVFMFIFTLPFILALAGIWFGLRDKRSWKFVLLFVILGAISFLFSMGTRLGPFSPFTWAYKLIPYFHMARAPYRYFYQGVLSVCLLSGFVLLKLPRPKVIALFLLITVPYIYAADFYGNKYNWTFIPAKEPAYFSQVRGWLEENNKENYRVVECFGTPGLLGIGQRMFPNGLDILMRGIDRDHLDRYLSLFGIKYILAPRLHSQRHETFDRTGYMPPRAGSDDAGYEEYYSAQTTEFRFVAERLGPDPGFVMHTAGTKDVAVFENKSAFEDYRVYRGAGVMVLGGSGAYDLLSLDRYKELRPAPIFIAQSKNLSALALIKSASGELILHNTDFIDLVFLLNQRHLVKLCDLGAPDWVYYGGSYGILQPVPAQDHSLGNFLFGNFCFSDFAIASDKQGAALDVSLPVRQSDYYRIMLRVFGGKNFGKLSCRLDGRELGEIDTSGFTGFRWVEIWEGNLQKGEHKAVFTLLNKAPVFLDALAFVPEPQLYAEQKKTLQEFKDMPVTYLINRQNIQRGADDAACSIFIGESAKYVVSLKVRSGAKAAKIQDLVLLIDGQDAAAYEYRAGPGAVSFIEFGPVEFKEGRHEVGIKNLSGEQILELISISKGVPRANAAGATVIVHTEANYPGWKMKVGKRVLEPVITNMFLNGFIVGIPGTHYLIPELRGQVELSNVSPEFRNVWQTAGVIISLAALAAIMFFVIRPPK